MQIVQHDNLCTKYRVPKLGSPPCQEQEISHSARCLETVVLHRNNFNNK